MANVQKTDIVSQVLNIDRSLAKVFFAHGLFCIGCAMAESETIEQACAGHGIDADALLKDINDYLNNSEKTEQL